MLITGDKAPRAIKIEDQDGNTVSLKDHADSYVVLYFYPKDNTPGCTVEACDFRDFNKDLKKLGVSVIGVSKDSPKSHQGFIEKQKLNFPLWSDVDHKLMEAFGTWVEKSMYGKKYMGIQRATFIINPKGKIIKVWEKVKSRGHAQEVYEFLKESIK